MSDDILRRKFPYRQMILTLWQEDGRMQTGPPRWRLSLQNPHTDERTGFQQVAELAAFLQAWMEEQSGQPDDSGH
jgi:hypothetical protein